MFCKACGKKIDDDSKFCKECGQPQQGASAIHAEPRYEHCHIATEWLEPFGLSDSFVNRPHRCRLIAKGEGPDEGKVYARGQEYRSKSHDLSAGEQELYGQRRDELAQQLVKEGWAWIGEHQYDHRYRRIVL